MAWSWSHTPEAYANLYHNLHQQDSEWLRICYAEWRGRMTTDNPTQSSPCLNQRRYEQALRDTQSIPNDVLADAIYQATEEQSTCTNGGHEAWCCPWGCHKLPFDKMEEPSASTT